MSTLRSRSLAALATMLALSACQAGGPAEAPLSEVHQSGTAFDSPEFAALAARARDVRVAQSAKVGAMTPAQRAAYLQDLVELRPTLDPEVGGSAELAHFTEVTGIAVPQVRQLRDLAAQFKQSYPDEPGGPSGPVQDDLPQLEPEDSAGSVPGGGGSSEADPDCIEECNDAYNDTATLAELVYIQESLLCIALAPLGTPIAALLCGAAALAELAATMAVADRNRDDCIDVCNDINPDGECSDDWDCDDSEYCWEGPVGFGDNECRDKKENGQVCSRDGKCESGCCKYDFWVNPVSFTCQPAGDCN